MTGKFQWDILLGRDLGIKDGIILKLIMESTGSVVVHWVHMSKNRVKSQDIVIKVMDLLLHRSTIL